ncbi:hypothetical protein AVEN_248840-1 [Araneus ventricosus]|uniref:Uncharacterized protein n=1 Tax=Araneus ventricosus TaxID=182803 RepID=A0A4Y2HWY6_ARAVE|nr:hypothetical protein AVEN_248840-1 [Araneus ventricosus]
MTRTSPELAPLSKLPPHTNGSTFDLDGFSVHQARLQGSFSVESGFEPGALWPRGRDLSTRPPRPKRWQTDDLNEYIIYGRILQKRCHLLFYTYVHYVLNYFWECK